MIYYTDGSAHPNPGPGGWGVVGVEDDQIKYVKSIQYNNTTNNEMELRAILHVLIHTHYRDNGEWFQAPIVYSDSAYCVNALNNWMFNWANKGWLKSDNKPPENLDIFKAYYALYELGYRIDLRKIKGHNGHKYNELADKLATGQLKEKDILKI